MTERAPHFAGEAQERLIEKLCGRADDLIAEARSSGEAAEQLKELCDQFERECASAMVAHAARQYVYGLLEKAWRAREDASRSFNATSPSTGEAS